MYICKDTVTLVPPCYHRVLGMFMFFSHLCMMAGCTTSANLWGFSHQPILPGSSDSRDHALLKTSDPVAALNRFEYTYFTHHTHTYIDIYLYIKRDNIVNSHSKINIPNRFEWTLSYIEIAPTKKFCTFSFHESFSSGKKVPDLWDLQVKRRPLKESCLKIWYLW